MNQMKKTVRLNQSTLEHIQKMADWQRIGAFQVHDTGCCANCVFNEWDYNMTLCRYGLSCDHGKICTLYLNHKHFIFYHEKNEMKPVGTGNRLQNG